MDERQQAAQKVIQLKKEWGQGGDDNSIASEAASLRKQFNLDESMYGSDVGLADAYSNYHKEFGMQQTQPQQQTQTQQQTQQPSFNIEGQKVAYEDMMRQSTDGFLQSQISQIESSAANQIAELEKAYQQAIEEGKLSVREAEKQFEMQKQQIEKQAYIDSERTNAHSQQRGIQNSQQMIGLMQGDNARKNSMLNSNASDRDFRINNIRDRINSLTHQKDIDMVNINKQKDYGILAAQGQTNQMYTEKMADFLGKDYFSQMGMQHDFNMQNNQMQHDVNMQNSQFDQRTKEIALQHGYDLDKMSIGQVYQQANMKYQNELDISKMFTGHKLDLEKMDKELLSTFAKMDKQFGFDSSLQGQSHSNSMAQISASVKAQAEAADAEYKIAMEREARRLGLTGEYDEYDISQALKREGREDALQVAKAKRDAAIQDSYAMGVAQYELSSIFENPDLELNPKKPKNYTDGRALGNYDPGAALFNMFTGYKKKDKKYEEEEAKKQAAQDAVDRFLAKMLGKTDDSGVQDKFNSLLNK